MFLCYPLLLSLSSPNWVVQVLLLFGSETQRPPPFWQFLLALWRLFQKCQFCVLAPQPGVLGPSVSLYLQTDFIWFYCVLPSNDWRIEKCCRRVLLAMRLCVGLSLLQSALCKSHWECCEWILWALVLPRVSYCIIVSHKDCLTKVFYNVLSTVFFPECSAECHITYQQCLTDSVLPESLTKRILSRMSCQHCPAKPVSPRVSCHAASQECPTNMSHAGCLASVSCQRVSYQERSISVP